MLAVFKNNWNRLWEEKMYLLISLILLIAAIATAILLSTQIETKGNIALVIPDQQVLPAVYTSFETSPYFNVTEMEIAPKQSELVQNRYDAIVAINRDGEYQITTIKNTEFKTMIEAALSNPEGFRPDNRQVRHTGTNILGFMMMFLLMQGILYARLYAEDKEKHMIKRISISPLPFSQYIFGQAIFIFMIIAIPSFLIITVVALMGIEIGFSLPVYAGLIAILALLSTAFALFLNAFFAVADTANMLGSAIIVLTSVLAGSFYSLSKEATLFDKLLHILPQKDFINFINALETGNLTPSTQIQLIYVVALALVFLAIAIVKTQNDYVYKS
ncbi:ABC transporter permease [Acetobacterium woodii]|uniref:ABC transport system permease protein n=1 Tax=Acetobacterium woodii (strain ATCC 29683 / DSM 1030 / JCM 2381 / KCTC 1655 / WB1) TaxID=931626 RepID=H6LJJ3_ACEWD|nr:ABC transporter permease [Acetobacterium woodii]AFA49921.1 ABC transport system permease protein [Acetobacterium woodii DSM 1030]